MLSEKIYALRRKNGLSQEQLAEKIGVSRQAISKWGGGMSTPELDKLKVLSEFFQVTIDELTGEEEPDHSAARGEQGQDTASGKPHAESRLGIGLCLFGAVCLILTGILIAVRPSAMNQVNESSAITLNGTGILLLLFVLCMVTGMILTLKKK